MLVTDDNSNSFIFIFHSILYNTGIPPASGEFGISPVYFKRDIDDTDKTFVNSLVDFVFPTQANRIRPLLHTILASFIFHENWTVANTTTQTSPLLTCNYFRFAQTKINRFELVETSLPWENKPGCPNFTGIPIHCEIMNKLLEVHKLQHDLPGVILADLKTEMNTRFVGDPATNLATRLMQKVDDIAKDIQNKLEQKFGVTVLNQESTPEARVLNEAVFRNNNIAPGTNEPVLVFPREGIWAHYWDQDVRSIPADFTFPRGLTLAQLWNAWHIPIPGTKVCGYKHIKPGDLYKVKRGMAKFRDMKLVVNEIIHEISKDTELYQKYTTNLNNSNILAQVFDEVKDMFKTTDLRTKRFSQLSWETFVRDSRANFRKRTKGADPPPSSKKTKRTTTATTTEDRRVPTRTTTATTVPTIPPMPSVIPATRRTQPRRRAKKNSTTTTKKNQVAKRRSYARRTSRRSKSSPAEVNDTFAQEFAHIEDPPPAKGSRVLERSDLGNFLPVNCSYCTKNTTYHRCLVTKKGGLIDRGKEICGKPFCRICAWNKWGYEGGPPKCLECQNISDV